MKAFYALVASLGILAGCGGDTNSRMKGNTTKPAMQEPASQDKVKDPVCGMMVDKATAKGHYDYKGGHYYFCSEDCLNKFKAAPEKYVK